MMMKKQYVVKGSFTWVFFGSLLLANASLAQAQEADAPSNGWYLTANVGIAQGDDSASKINDQLSGAGLNAQAKTDSTRRGMFLLGGGYHFTDSLSAELAYVNLGKVKTTFTGVASDVATFLNKAEDIHPQTAQGFRFSGAYRASVVDTFDVALRLGVYSWQSEYELEAAGTSRDVRASGASLTYGLGAEMQAISPNLRMGLYYDNYNIEGESIDVLSAGMTYLID